MSNISSIKPNLDPPKNQSLQGTPAESVWIGIQNKPIFAESVWTGVNTSHVKYIFIKI